MTGTKDPAHTLEQHFTVDNELGLHLRAAGRFAQTCGKFSANVWIKKDNIEVNAKSIMGILSLGAARGTALTVRVAGGDADQAMHAIASLFASKFHED